MSFMATFSKMLMILFAISMGYLANRLKILDDGSNRKLTKLVLNITIPGLILSAVMTGEAQPEVGTVLSVWKMAAVYYAVELVAVLVVPPLLGGTDRQKGVWRFSLLFTNAIFIGYSVLGALYGERAVFYAVLLTLPVNALSFSVGPLMLGGSRRFSWKSLCTPSFLSSVLSLVIVLAGIQVPAYAGEVLGFVGDMTAPLSLLVLGSVLAGMPLGKVFAMPRIWALSFVRLVAMPVLLLVCLRPLGLDPVVLSTGVIIMATPAAVNGFMLAIEHDGDSECMAQTIFLSTLCSIVTIPLVATLI
jgi:predicted permease